LKCPASAADGAGLKCSEHRPNDERPHYYAQRDNEGFMHDSEFPQFLGNRDG